MIVKLKTVIGILLAVFFLTSCQQSLFPAPPPTATFTPRATDAPTSTRTPKPTIATRTPTPIVLGPTNFPADVNPLTGLVVQDPDLLNRIPIAVKVANYPISGRPHAGLSFADIVYEYTIGEGANRFLAIFYGQDSPQVGPIRSGRLVDARLVPMYHGALVFQYADPTVLDTLLSALPGRAIIGGPNSAPAVWADGGDPVAGVDFWFANTAEVSQLLTRRQIANVRQPLDGMSFDSRPPAAGEQADQLSVIFGLKYEGHMNKGDWCYDPQSGTYLRWIDSADESGTTAMIPLVDRVTGKQLAFDNVVVMFVEHTDLAQMSKIDVDIFVSGNNARGKVALFRDGKMIEGTWRSTNPNTLVSFSDASGNPLAFKPGNTWIVLAAKYSTLTELQPGNWEMFFNGH